MADVHEFPGSSPGSSTPRISEYDALMAAAPSVLDAIPGAVYLCDQDGWLIRYNTEAAEIWGRSPSLSESRERFCGSHRLLLPDGTPLAHEDCPMAIAIRTGEPTSDAEIIIERADGSRLEALVNVRVLKDQHGKIQGAINCFQDISERKAMEKEVRKKDADLEDFFENSAVALHIVNADGIIERANQAELSLLGYDEDEYIGRHIAEFHADAPVIGDILRKLSSGEKLDRHPARLRAKDGSIKHVRITSNSRFENDQFLNTRCFTTDVTDLRYAETARRESESRLAATYEAATVGIAETNAEGRFLRVNDAICKMMGYSREDLLTMSFLDFTHEDDREEDAALYARQIGGEIDSYSIRKRAFGPDGTEVYIDVHSSSVRDESGSFHYGVRVIQDVTKAKRLEDKIRESERYVRDLLDALPAAVYTTDAEGRIVFYNTAAVEMSGRTPEANDFWCVSWRLYHPDGSPMPHEECPMAITLKENRAVRGAEAIVERPDGSRIPFLPYPTPLRDADGKLIGAINMMVDITERKQAENRQSVLVAELNHRVKNTLATVQSLANQTARHAENLNEFHHRFEARLLALSRAHDLLTARHWEDAPLESLAREILTPHVGGSKDRLVIDGPSVALHPRSALSLTMALNELATNAVKYGALSSETGNLSVVWHLHGRSNAPMLTLNWREEGGPRVSPPSHRGFGTRLMRNCIERDIGGEFELTFDPKGVMCCLSIPLELARR